MTEFERKLSDLSPAAVDRDALLFAAGRASAPSPRWWRRACGLLAVTQLVTLGLWLTSRPQPTRVDEPLPAASPTLPAPSPPDPSSYLALLRTWDQPPASPPAAVVPDGPALKAGSRSF